MTRIALGWVALLLTACAASTAAPSPTALPTAGPTTAPISPAIVTPSAVTPASSTPVIVTPAHSSGEIAFVSDRGGKDAIYLMAGDGSGIRKLTSNGADNREPAWSGDGGELAYTVIDGFDETGAISKSHVAVLKVDGGQEVDLTAELTQASQPVWSLERGGAGSGRRIAVTARVSGGSDEREVFVVDPLGTGNFKQVTNFGGGSLGCWMPRWRPDGRTLVVYCQGLMVGGFQVVDLATGRMTPFPVAEPGSALAALSTGGLLATDDQTAIRLGDSLHPDAEARYLMPAGSDTPVHDAVGLAWSPVDPDLLAVRQADALIVVNIKDFSVVTLADHAPFAQPADLPPSSPVKTYPSTVSWSADGRWIAFVAWIEGSEEIAAASLDQPGSIIRLTADPATDIQPAWRP